MPRSGVKEGQDIRDLDVSFVLGSLLGGENAFVALLDKFCNTKLVRFAESEFVTKEPSCIRREPLFRRGDEP